MKDYRYLRYFFQPEGVAVIGASTNPRKGGSVIVQNLRRWYPGPIYPINPKAETILGLQVYPTIMDVPERVDLAVVFVPASVTPAALIECGEKGVKAVLIEGAGFAEAGPEGLMLTNEILNIAERYGMRIWGPNCAGMADAANGLVTVFTPYGSVDGEEGVIPLPLDRLDAVREKGVSMIGQSGMILAMGALVNTVMPMGVAKVCSVGNKADLNESDFLEYLGEDKDTKVISCYLESLVDGRRFMDAAKRISRKKPLLVLKSGRTSQGAKAGASHTAGLAVDDRVVEDAFKQAGIIRIDDMMDLMWITKTFSLLPFRNAGNRVAIITSSGAGGVLAADELVKRGMSIPPLSQSGIARLRTVFRSWAEPDNPIDFWSAGEQMGQLPALMHCLEVALEEDGIDMAIVIAYTGILENQADFAALSDLVKRYDKPVVAWLVPDKNLSLATRLEAETCAVPFLPSMNTAAEALKAMRDFAAWSKTDQPNEGSTVALESLKKSRAILDKAVRAQMSMLNEADGKQILSDYGVRPTAEILVSSEDDAVAAAAKLSYPVALKLSSSEISHKSDIGGVRLNIGDETQVRKAYREILNAVHERLPQAKQDGVLVQEMLNGGTEVIIGMIRNPQFGPVVMFGLGGIFVEVFKDVAFRVAPLTEADADAMIEQVNGHQLLKGVRGKPPADIAAIKAAILAVSRIGIECPEVEQIDINPLIVFSSGQGAKAADAVIVLRTDRISH